MTIVDLLTENNIEFSTHESMSDHSTFRVGGEADYFVLPQTPAQLAKVLRFTRENDIPCVVLGRGSNILVSDSGIRGVVLCTKNLDEIIVEGNMIIAHTGATLSQLSVKACELGLSGFDFAYGIPGTVGGAIVMNAGAYGGEIKDVLLFARILTADGELITLSKDDLDLSYRHSCIEEKGYVVLTAAFTGDKGNREQIQKLMDEHMASRKEKQPLEYPSAGSTFKRPEGMFAGKLIQDAGLKGYMVGGAQVSEKHCGFVINKGNATASDVLAVINHVKEKVYENSGVNLECEMKLL